MNTELESMGKSAFAGGGLGFVILAIRFLMVRSGWRPKPAKELQPSRGSSVFFAIFFGGFAAFSFIMNLPWGGSLFLLLAILAPVFDEFCRRRAAQNKAWSAQMRRFSPHVITERLSGVPFSVVNAWQTGQSSPPKWEQQIMLEKLGEPPIP